MKKSLVNLWNKAIDGRNRVMDRVTILEDSLRKQWYPRPSIPSIDETIDRILETKCSVSRFGDGEFKLMMGKDIAFQDHSPELERRLREVVRSPQENLMVCIPDIFRSLDRYDEEFHDYWELHVARNRKKWYGLLDPDKTYHNAFISRPYYGFRDKENSRAWFEKMKSLWNGKAIVIIEGEKSRLGMGNDLFRGASSIQRILCPAEHAFSRYPTILSAVEKLEKDRLFLLALGPTATVLAHDLCKRGYQAVDIGHIDVEYEWFLRGASQKERIRGKYVCEAGGGRDLEEIYDERYAGEILLNIRGEEG